MLAKKTVKEILCKYTLFHCHVPTPPVRYALFARWQSDCRYKSGLLITRLISHFLAFGFLCVFAGTALANENESATQTGISFQDRQDDGRYSNFFASSYFQEGFSRNILSYVNLEIGKEAGNSSHALGWYTLMPRTFEDREIRFYQQYSYRFLLGKGVFSLSTYLDERYFDESHELGFRTRFRTQWVRPLNERYSLQVGQQTHFALNDVDQKNMMQSGFRQTRLILGINRLLSNGNGINVNYQLRYLNRAFSDNVILNHLQFIYTVRL